MAGNIKLTQAKKKRRGPYTKESPFPVPVASYSHQYVGRWSYYSGELVGNHVVIKHSGDMGYLYKMGFFGKGTLSRSGTDYNKLPRASRRNLKGEQIRIIPKRKYFNHLHWSREKEGLRTSLTDSGTNIFGSPAPTTISLSDNIPVTKKSRIDSIMDYDNNSSDQSNDSIKNTEEKTWESDTASEQPDIFMGADDSVQSLFEQTGYSSREASNDSTDMKMKVNSWHTNSEKDSSKFWTSKGDSLSKMDKGGRDAWDTTDEKVAEDFWNSENKEWNSGQDEFWSSVTKDKTLYEPPEVVDNTSNISKSIERTNSGNTQMDINSDEKNVTSDQNIMSPNRTKRNISPRKRCDTDRSHTHESDDIIDPRSESNDLSGELFVVEDTDVSDEGDEDMGIVKKMKWRPCMKTDPYKVTEYLQLSLEEAFFLSYGLGCLVVHDGTKKSMNLSEMWKRFAKLQKSFIPNYIAYHNFRSKGWVPKTGLKYGAEFILYKDGPPFYHSSYSVVVRMVDEDTLQDDPEYENRPVTWPSLAGMNRVTEQVNKELLLCYVIKPSSLTVEDITSPACITRFKVQEIIMKRWVTSKEKLDEEFP